MKLRDLVDIILIIAAPLLLVFIIFSYLAKKGKCPFCAPYYDDYYYDECFCDDDDCCCDDDDCCCDECEDEDCDCGEEDCEYCN